MTKETVENTTKTFKFSFPTCTNEEVLFKLEVPVAIPLEGSSRELVQRVINMFHIPVYLEDELNEKLAEFVAQETRAFYNERDKQLLDRLKSNELDVDGIVKQWEKLFKETVVEFGEQRGTPDEEVLAAAHQRLSHSPALSAMLRRETGYARAVARLVRDRDHDIATMVQRQSSEMDSAVGQLGAGTSEADVNALAAQQWAQGGATRAKWASARDALTHAQRAEHRAWMMAALADQLSAPGETPPEPVGGAEPPPSLSLPAAAAPAAPPSAPSSPRLEESFTIHLGSQLKLTHNIRIAAMDLLDLTRLNPDNPAEWSRRMQTALSLYGGELSAVVVLSECVPERPEGATAALLEAAAASTDHHFPDADDQLHHIAEKVKQPVEERNRRRFEQEESSASASASASACKVRVCRNLQPGDVFVTRHSNLADVHVVFHLLVDDSLRGDISSRHPVILGLRSILRACCANDITALALPLLLAHEHTEEMTLGWCSRRAELVLKCVKGFALETAGGGGAELRTLTLALPPDADPSVFHALAALTPTIFRLSNPVKAKPSPS